MASPVVVWWFRLRTAIFLPVFLPLYWHATFIVGKTFVIIASRDIYSSEFKYECPGRLLSGDINLRRKQTECNITIERMCRQDKKAVQNRCPRNTSMPDSPVALRAGTCLWQMTAASCLTSLGALCSRLTSRLAWYHEHTAAMATELLQPLDLVCGTLYWSSCAIQISPTTV